MSLCDTLDSSLSSLSLPSPEDAAERCIKSKHFLGGPRWLLVSDIDRRSWYDCSTSLRRKHNSETCAAIAPCTSRPLPWLQIPESSDAPSCCLVMMSASSMSPAKCSVNGVGMRSRSRIYESRERACQMPKESQHREHTPGSLQQANAKKADRL